MIYTLSLTCPISSTDRTLGYGLGDTGSNPVWGTNYLKTKILQYDIRQIIISGD